MSARVRSSTNSYNQPWVADLSSTYVVNGKYYSGFHRIRARSEGRTEEKIVAGRAEWSLCGIPRQERPFRPAQGRPGRRAIGELK
jgi:hypothetical protein